MVVTGIVAGGLVLVMLIALSTVGADPSTNERSPAAAQPESAKSEPAKRSIPNVSAVPSGVGRAGTKPDEPAPPIEAGLIEELDGLYRQAKEHWNNALVAKKNSKLAEFKDECHAGWDDIKALNARIDPHLTWHEKADFGGWEIPASYTLLLNKMSKWDKLQQRIKKNMPRR